MSEQEHIIIVLTETGQTFKWKTNEDPTDVESRLLTRESKFELFMGIDDSGRPVRHQIWIAEICFVGIGEVGMITNIPAPKLM